MKQAQINVKKKVSNIYVLTFEEDFSSCRVSEAVYNFS